MVVCAVVYDSLVEGESGRGMFDREWILVVIS